MQQLSDLSTGTKKAQSGRLFRQQENDPHCAFNLRVLVLPAKTAHRCRVGPFLSSGLPRGTRLPSATAQHGIRFETTSAEMEDGLLWPVPERPRREPEAPARRRHARIPVLACASRLVWTTGIRCGISGTGHFPHVPTATCFSSFSWSVSGVNGLTR